MLALLAVAAADDVLSLVTVILSLWPMYAQENGIDPEKLGRSFGVDEGYIFFGEGMGGKMAVAEVKTPKL